MPFVLPLGIERLIHASLFFFFLGCSSLPSSSLLFNMDEFEELRTYEKDYASRIQQYLEIAEQDLLSNYKKKEYFMIRKNSPSLDIHPRKDLSLRDIISSAFEEKKITHKEYKKFLKKCDKLHDLWENQWKTATRRSRHMGFTP